MKKVNSASKNMETEEIAKIDEVMTANELWDELSLESEDNQKLIDEAEMISGIVFKLIKARVDKKMTQATVAKLAGLKQSAVARVESMTSIPRIDTLVKIAVALGVTIKIEETNNRCDCVF